MATNYNITMRQFNGTDYDTLYPAANLANSIGTLGVAHGGTGVTSISALQDQLGLNQYAKIQTGSYTGTGTYGSSNPNSLTFNFSPNMLIIFGMTAILDSNNYVDSCFSPVVFLPTSNSQYQNYPPITILSTFDNNWTANVSYNYFDYYLYNNQFSLYASSFSSTAHRLSTQQLNSKDGTYYYEAIG